MVHIHSHFLCFLLTLWADGLGQQGWADTGQLTERPSDAHLALSSLNFSSWGVREGGAGLEKGCPPGQSGVRDEYCGWGSQKLLTGACGSEPRRAGLLITGVHLWVASSQRFTEGPFQKTPIMTQLN